MIEQAKFTYSPLGNALEKQRKTIKNQGEKQIKALENRVENTQIKISRFFVLKRYSTWRSYIWIKQNILDRNYLIYKTGDKKRFKTYNLQKFKTIRFLRIEIYNNGLSLDNSLKQQLRLKDGIDIFKESAKQIESVKKE